MARVTRMKVEGLRELDKALGELPKSTGKNVLRRTLKKAGEPLRADWASRAPKATGDLSESVAISTKLGPRQKRLQRKRHKSTVEVFVGAGKLPQAHLQEWGSAHHAPQPHARPAWDANQMRTLEIVKSELSNEIEAARKRLARKAARVAAKIRRT